MTQVPSTPPPPKPTPPPSTPQSTPPGGASGASGAPEKAAPKPADTSTVGGSIKANKQIADAGKEAKKAQQPQAPKLTGDKPTGDAAKKAPAFDRPEKPKSNLADEPKSSKDVIKDQHKERGSDAAKKDAADPKAADKSDGGGEKPQSAREAKADAAKDMAKQQAGQAVEMGLDQAAGAGTTKDLKAMVAKEDENGDKVGADERTVALAKNAGRAANIIWGGRNEAINTGIDKVGDGLMAAAKFKKRKKKEFKQAVSGKSLMDAASSPEAQENMKRKKADGLGSAMGGKSKDKKKSGGGDKPGGPQSGSGGAGGMGIGGKAGIGIGAAVLAVVLIASFIFGGGQLSPHDGQPDEESDEQVMEYVPGGEEGWYGVATWSVAHQNYSTSPKQVPWPLIMGLAAEQTDLGRYSPYDSIDREPDRESTNIIAPGGGGGGDGGGNVVIDNTGDMDRSNPAWRQQIAMQAFVSAGFTPEQSAGIVGNMITESGVEPARAEVGKAFPSTWGWGLVQWTFSRNTTVVNKVKSELGAKFYTNNPSSLSDDEWVSLMELQVSHTIHELDTTHKHAGDPLRNATTASEASSIFLEKFEVPADIPGNRPIRAAQAEEVLRIYNQGGVDALSNGNVAVNITREEAEWLTFNSEDQVRVEPVASADCPVPNPDPAIGGGEGEGVGPYLLTEAAAEQARTGGYDPNSPCVGRWIADQLAASTGEVSADDEYEFMYHDDSPWPYGENNGPGGDGTGGGGGTGETGSVQYPVSQDIPMTSPFGPRRHPITGEYKSHNGTDWGAPGGTPIGSLADGVVKDNVSKTTGWGNYVVITHQVGGKEVESLYAHMQQKSPLQVGASVKAGDIVGKVGTTGSSTGDHLHLEIRIDGELTDPAKWLKDNTGGSNASASATPTEGGNVGAGINDLVVGGNVSGSDDDDSEEDAGGEDDTFEPDEELVEKFEDNVAYWEAVVATTGLFADRNATGESCELTGGGSSDESGETYAQQIIYSFHCEVAKNPDITTIMSAYYSAPPAGATDEEIDDHEAKAVFDSITSTYEAERQIIEEALRVSYTATEWDLDCSADAERAGLFMLTEDEMKDGGFSKSDRCDSAKNAAAAAKLYVEGEAEALDKRKTDEGDFQPAFGGWGNISIALGTEDREDFATIGSGNGSPAVSEKCTAKIEDWVKHVAKKDKAGGEDGDTGFGDFVGQEDLEADKQREKVRLGETWTEDLSGGSLIGFGGNNPPHLQDDCAGGSARDYAEVLGETAVSLAQDETDEERKDALNGYATWTGWVRAAEGGKPEIGVSSLVERLSVYSYEYPEVPIEGEGLTMMILDQIGTQNGFVPVHQRSVEYAIFFGGLSQPFDTAEKLYGSLLEAGNTGGGLPGNNGGGGQTEVDAEGCPVEVGPKSGALTGGSEKVGINELCKRSVEQARSPEAAVALKWGFQQVGVQMYSQPKRMDDMYSDCSSYVSRAYQEGAGLELYPPGTNAWVTSTFAGRGEGQGVPQVSQDDLQPGDWWMPNSGHIVMVIADGYVMHASKPGDPIKIGTFYTGSFNKGGYIDPSYFPKLDHHGQDQGGSDDEKDAGKADEED